jgi:hypothetical protein
MVVKSAQHLTQVEVGRNPGRQIEKQFKSIVLTLKFSFCTHGRMQGEADLPREIPTPTVLALFKPQQTDSKYSKLCPRQQLCPVHFAQSSKLFTPPWNLFLIALDQSHLITRASL